jgi:hypothetical protein
LPRKNPPLVRWSTASQESLTSNLFPWRGKDPNTLDVLYSQENLWVLRQLMQVIATVNGEAKQPFQAVIREINELAIGRAASTLGGGDSLAGGGDSSGMLGGAGLMGSLGDDEGDDMGSGGMMGGGGTPSVSPDPADMRYVDVNYEPMDAVSLRTKMASSSPDDAYTTVAKRIPVRMNLKMDQRKIPLLIAECGNAALMIEVRQVRINPKSGAGMGGPGMGGGMGGPGMGGPAMGGAGLGGPGMGAPDMGGGLGGGLGGGGTARASEFPNEVTVEVSGIVYIYNKPDMTKLGVEKVDENTLIEGDSETVAGAAVAPEAPAASPPPADSTPTADDPAENAPATGGTSADAPSSDGQGTVPDAGQPSGGQPAEGQSPAGAGVPSPDTGGN